MTLGQRLAAEGLGSLVLTAAVIGSGVMAERLADGNAALALLANTAATVAALGVLITLLSPVSGAHFNPAVTLVEVASRSLPLRDGAAYVAMQVGGCCAGVLLAHAMFDLPLLQVSTRVRSGTAQYLAEVVATAGLLLVVLGGKRAAGSAWLVAAWIGAAYWFTASTSFANPAITFARSLSDTFAGIRPADVPAFAAAQIAGALVGLGAAHVVFGRRRAEPDERAAADYFDSKLASHSSSEPAFKSSKRYVPR